MRDISHHQVIKFVILLFMTTKDIKLDPKTIKPLEASPMVSTLLSVIEQLTLQLQQQSVQLSQQAEAIARQTEKIDALLNEIGQLKKLSKKPKLRASNLPKEPDDKDEEPPMDGSGNTKRPGSSKRSKNTNLKIDKEELISAENIPVGSVRKGYQSYIIQDLIVQSVVTKYRLERWQLPNGSYVTATLPKALQGHHFGPTLRAYVLHQHHHQCVTQPLLHKQLLEWGIDISTGQLNRLLTENKEEFHHEKSALLPAGLSVSSYIQVDDTGARHQGKNGYCTFIGNELFSWFESTGSKSRINFLELLNTGYDDYNITEESFAYMERYKVAPWIRKKLTEAPERGFANRKQFEEHLQKLSITNTHYRRLLIEAALIGSILSHGFPIDMVILSDDAGQFNVLIHALCWIHAERGIKSLAMSNEIQTKAVEWARNEVWEIYQALRDYKNSPNEEEKIIITKRFDDLCTTKTEYYSLNQVLKRLYKNKDELLLVLERPDIPLHNNLSERDIREYVKRRKISGSTRSDEGRRCRDTFASLKKTALKIGVSFWDYLIDRVAKKYDIPSLDQLVLAAHK
ncbi:IS66 family transposase [Legionella anisa]|uniref:IS66 family transposase n=1 Tax=Legionella anisa TaxID=28082 RepID=UPI001A94F730|nr:transposase [Legionella anisa]